MVKYYKQETVERDAMQAHKESGKPIAVLAMCWGMYDWTLLSNVRRGKTKQVYAVIKNGELKKTASTE